MAALLRSTPAPRPPGSQVCKMGKRSRLHRLAVQQGKEQPFRSPEVTRVFKRCLKCDHGVAESAARDHIRKGWGYPIRDDEPVPNRPVVK